jgi:predicted nucleic acid-binding protein
MEGAEERILIDTSVLIYATLASDPRTARAKVLSIASLPTLQVLPLTGDLPTVALELCEKYGITPQRYFDAQLVATMIVHEIRTLVTENEKDFDDIVEIRVVNPFLASS